MYRIKTISRIVLVLSTFFLGTFIILVILTIDGTGIFAIPSLFVSIPLLTLSNLLSFKVKAEKAALVKGKKLFKAGWITSALTVGLVVSWLLIALASLLRPDLIGWFVVTSALILMINVYVVAAYGIIIRRALTTKISSA